MIVMFAALVIHRRGPAEAEIVDLRRRAAGLPSLHADPIPNSNSAREEPLCAPRSIAASCGISPRPINA